MNEQIRRLADKIWAEEYWDNPMTDKLLPAQLNRFAELILKDVFNRFGDEILSLHYLEQGCCQDSVHLLKSKIQEHFGIQE